MIGDYQDGDGYGVFGRQVEFAEIFADGFELRAGDVCQWSSAVGSGDSCTP